MQHLIDTPIQLGQCSQCEAFVYSCQVSGFKVMCNPAPLDGMEDIRAALVNGAQVFRVLYIGKKPNKLSSLRPYQYKFVGIGEVAAVAEHLCPARHKHTAKPEVTPLGPPSAPVRPTSAPLGESPTDAPEGLSGAHRGSTPPEASSSTSPPRVMSAILRPSRATRCDICNKLIKADTPDTWAIEYDGRLVWARHEQC